MLKRLSLRADDWDEAERALLEAVEVTIASESATEEVDARIALTRLHLETRSYEAARREAESALEAAKTAAQPRQGCRGLQVDGRTTWAHSQPAAQPRQGHRVPK